MAKTAAIILAAGKSTRMKSDLPKVLHETCGRPMLWFVLEACREAGVQRLVVVVGHRQDLVKAAFAGQHDITWVEQGEQLGTGHAALVCADALRDFAGPVVCIAGDMPLIQADTVTKIVAESEQSGHAVTLATTILDDPTGYGRIIRDGEGRLSAIVEHNDCTPEQRAVREVNISYYCFAGRRMFELLRRVGNQNAKNEYYITDTVGLALAAGWGAGAIPAVPPEDALGINSRRDLALVNRTMQDRIQGKLMDQGVTIVDPSSTWIESGAVIGRDATILPFSYIGATAVVDAGERVGPHALLSSPGTKRRAGLSRRRSRAGAVS